MAASGKKDLKFSTYSDTRESLEQHWFRLKYVQYSHNSFGRMSKKSGVNGKHMTR